jgi:hypothetical protein
MGTVAGIAHEILGLVAELKVSPILCPLFLVVMWRAYAFRLRGLKLSGLIIVNFLFAMLLAHFSPSYPPLVNEQQVLLDNFRSQLTPRAQELVLAWGADERILSLKAQAFAWCFYFLMLEDFTRRPWYKSVFVFLIDTIAITALTSGWFFLLMFNIDTFAPRDLAPSEIPTEIPKWIDFIVSAPVAAIGLGMASWVLVRFLRTYMKRHRVAVRLSEAGMNIIITVIILSFALAGFWFLPTISKCILWMLFWIVAYPVALSFTRGRPLQGEHLVEIYKAGLTQVPVLGKLFEKLMGGASDNAVQAAATDSDRTRPKP